MTLDLETRGDLVFAALRESRRAVYFRRNRGDLVDLSGVGRSQVLDAVAGALSVPVLTPPHVISFSPESYWKGESHRITDRVGGVARLMEEFEAAGVEQVIAVCADAERAAPHRLVRPSDSLETRLAEQYAALETAGLRDALAAHAARFSGLFVIQPGLQSDRAVRLCGCLRRSLRPAPAADRAHRSRVRGRLQAVRRAGCRRNRIARVLPAGLVAADGFFLLLLVGGFVQELDQQRRHLTCDIVSHSAESGLEGL